MALDTQTALRDITEQLSKTVVGGVGFSDPQVSETSAVIQYHPVVGDPVDIRISIQETNERDAAVIETADPVTQADQVNTEPSA